MRTSQLHLHMTGFGPFKAITDNPSATIGATVALQLAEKSTLSVHYEELAVELEAVSTYFTSLEETLSQQMDCNGNDERVLLVHLGVHSTEMNGQLRLEVCGYNELEGNPIDISKPMDVSLESAFIRNGSNTATATTTLIEQLNTVIQSLEERRRGENTNDHSEHKGPRWIISHDAGRYYCNYALYRSLKLQERWNGRVFAVFVHVVIPEICGNPSLEEQISQVRSLILGLVEIVNEKT
ncbi:pyroglutamyl-peptidase I (PGP) [Trypanosoma theileri]|uniref:Pyroglutamyl-peptidase I (PGP) n=1 Tax=Trypanosoma theileri TaxID=67003 RepID=A0A1X0P9S4_9TRYP|nr:pyroglutamyl-peptidase I (PGP) [Trypanosoma theileri]ORC93581.1 pyroglutamyl-peptidase I (PGP) [Trypanosoma theileri]